MMRRKVLGIVCLLALSGAVVQVQVLGASVDMFVQHYEAAQEYYNQSQYSSAISEFRKALRVNYMDTSARTGLINSYLARASYYANQEKNYEKSANDFRSALFYLKIYTDKEQAVQNSSSLIISSMENLNQCLNVTGFDTTPASRYKKAEELRATGNFSAAAFEFSQAAQSSKLASNANCQIADLLKLLGNEARSINYYKAALELNPADGLLRMKYARTLDKLGRYDDAVVQYNEALANSKGDMEVLYALERLYLKKLAQTPSDAELNANIGAIKQAQGDFDTALSYYGKAEKLNPSNVNTRLNVGTLFQQKKEYQKAIRVYDSILEAYPNNVQANLYKAQVLTETGDKKGALELYQKIVSLEPDNKAAKSEMIIVMQEVLAPKDFIAYLNKNSSSDVNSQGVLYDYAVKMHKDNNLDYAIMAYKATLVNNPSNVDAYVNLAICYAAQNDYKNAADVLNIAKSKFPTNNLVLKTIQNVEKDSVSTILANASTSYENKDYKKAIELYSSINPATEASLLGIAAAYQGLENVDKAVEYYKKAESISPNNAEIPYYIGYLLSEQQNWQEAENYLKKALKLNKNSQAKDLLPYVVQNYSSAILTEGIKLFEANDFVLALSKFNEVIKKEISNAYAYYYRAMIFDEQKKHNLAIDDYLNVLKYTEELPIANYMLAIDYDTVNNSKEAYKYYQEFVNKYTTDDEYLKYAKARVEELKADAG